MLIWGFGKDEEEHTSFQSALKHVWTSLHVGYQDASGDSVVGMPESTVFFSVFVADPLAGDCVHRSWG